MVRLYAQVVGIVVLLIGVAGLLVGDGPLFGGDQFGMNSNLAEDIIHLVTGGLLAYAGFRGTDALVRSVAGGVGVVYLLIGVIGLFPGSTMASTGPDELFGLLPDGLTPVDNGIHLAVGVLGVALAWLFGRRAAAPA